MDQTTDIEFGSYPLDDGRFQPFIRFISGETILEFLCDKSVASPEEAEKLSLSLHKMLTEVDPTDTVEFFPGGKLDNGDLN